MRKIVLLILLFLVSSYIYAQNEKVMKPKCKELKISLKVENSTWIENGNMPVIVEITNYSKSGILFNLASVRFQLSPIDSSFTRTFIIPTNEIKDDKSTIKIKGRETISQSFNLSELIFLEFDSTDSGRKFGELPNGKYRLTAILGTEYSSIILIDYLNLKK